MNRTQRNLLQTGGHPHMSQSQFSTTKHYYIHCISNAWDAPSYLMESLEEFPGRLI